MIEKEKKIARSQDDTMAIVARLTAVTPALRAAGDTQSIIAALEKAARDLEEVLEPQSHL